MAKAYLTGQQILDEYGRIDYDLIVAVAVRRELQPIDPLTTKAITEEDDPCFFCGGGVAGIYFDESARFCEIGVSDLTPRSDPEKCFEWQDEHLAKRLRVATFSCDNVVAYAGKYWLAVPDQDPGEKQQIEKPKEYAEQLLADGLQPGQVMLELVKRYGARTMPQWKAAGLTLKKPIVDLDQFEKDKLKSRFADHTKKLK
jgi:hypothetical protein